MKREQILYYKTEDKLISYNLTTSVIQNRKSFNNEYLTKEQFDKLEKKPIKLKRFRELLNEYFRNSKVSWLFQGEYYKKLPPFEDENDERLKTLPYHLIPGGIYYKYAQLCWHNNKLYYFKQTHEKSYYLYDIYTLRFKRASIKNLSPIQKIDTKEMI